MSFEPEKFFIGLMDFFSILLPGALLTYFVEDTAGPWLLGDRYFGASDAEAATRFLFCSYLLGHFIFLAGSWIDPLLYDPFRKGTDAGQIERLAKGKKLYPRWLRKLAAAIYKHDDEALRQTIRIKDRYIEPTPKVAINAFQWSKAHLTLEKPSMMAKVERFEADSKFFRSLAVVLMALLMIEMIMGGRRSLLILSAIGIVPALWRYGDQRGKAIVQAYWSVMTLEASKPDAPKPTSDGGSSSERAGGVVFRKHGGVIEYLLVESSREQHVWVLPKGHIEPNENAKQAAVREVREESGVWARVRAKLDTISYQSGGETVDVEFYLMEALEEGKTEEPRGTRWTSFRAIDELKPYAEVRSMIERAHVIQTRPAS